MGARAQASCPKAVAPPRSAARSADGISSSDRKNVLGRAERVENRGALKRLFRAVFPPRRRVLGESKAMQFSHRGSNYSCARRLVSSIFYGR